MCETLLSSTNHLMVTSCSSITLFVMHGSYGLSLNPKYDSVVENKKYHRRALSIIPLTTFKISTYSTFLPFSYVTNFSYSGFTWHIISTNSPSNFMCTTLSSGSDAWRYDPGTSNVYTALYLWVSINNDKKSASGEVVGDVASSCRI